MQIKSIVECSLLTFIKLPFVIKIYDLSILEWLFNTGFTKISMSVIQLVQIIRFYHECEVG